MKHFWLRLTSWWNRIAEPHSVFLDSLSDKVVKFGLQPSRKYFVFNQILILAKKYIHDAKLSSQHISFLTFLVSLKQHILYEMEICFSNNKVEYVETNWKWLYEEVWLLYRKCLCNKLSAFCCTFLLLCFSYWVSMSNYFISCTVNQRILVAIKFGVSQIKWFGSY